VYRKADRCKLSFPAIQPPPHCPDDRCDSVFAVPQLDNVQARSRAPKRRIDIGIINVACECLLHNACTFRAVQISTTPT
jgi:hypothetical protein